MRQYTPTVQQQITKQQLTFISKVVQNYVSQIPTQLLITWCNNPQRQGGAFQNNKKNLSQNTKIIVPSAENNGRLLLWEFFALDSPYWNHMIYQLGMKPSTQSENGPGKKNTTITLL